jgi:LacI family transcriptional regulator
MCLYCDTARLPRRSACVKLSGGDGLAAPGIDLLRRGRVRRVGLIIDLGWAYQHHHGVFLGTQRYAQQHADWDCMVSPHLDASFRYPGSPSRYDGVIARVTPQLAAHAKKARVPLVNVRFQTPARGVPTVAPDRRAEGCMAAEHLLARGFRHFAYLGFHRDKNSRLQLAGYRATLKQAGFDCEVHLTRQTYDQTNSTWQEFLAGIYRWIDCRLRSHLPLPGRRVPPKRAERTE